MIAIMDRSSRIVVDATDCMEQHKLISYIAYALSSVSSFEHRGWG